MTEQMAGQTTEQHESFKTTITSEILNRSEKFLFPAIQKQQKNHELRIVSLLGLERGSQVKVIIWLTGIIAMLSFVLIYLFRSSNDYSDVLLYLWVTLGFLSAMFFLFSLIQGFAKMDAMYHSFSASLIQFRIGMTFRRTHRLAPIEVLYKLTDEAIQISIEKLKIKKQIRYSKINRIYRSPDFFCFFSSSTSHFWSGFVYYETEEDARKIDHLCEEQNMMVINLAKQEVEEMAV